MVLMTNKTIWGTGLNQFGQLGLGDTSDRNTLTRITSDISGCTPLSISCGDSHTMVLMTNGTIWGTGLNDNGQLGLGDNSNRNTLIRITSNISGCRPLSISCGANHTMVLMTNGTIWGTGLNGTGQLGLGDLNNRNTLTQITSDISGCTPLSISCGTFHTMVLMQGGTIWGTGFNGNGQLGLGDITFKNTLTRLSSDISGCTPLSISCGSDHTMVLMTNNTIWGTGQFVSEIGNTNTLTKLITNNTGFIHIAGGYDVYPYPIRFNTDINVIGKDSYQNLYDTNVQPSQMTISNKNSFNNATLSSDTLQFYNMSTSLSSSYGINGASLSEPIRYNYSALSLPISDKAVGYIQDGTGTVPSNVNATDKILKTLVLGPGIWRLSGSCGFDASVAKYHILSITTLPDVPRIEASCQTRVHSDNDALPVLQCQRFVTNDVSKTYYLVAQSEHITDILSPTVIFQAIRIG